MDSYEATRIVFSRIQSLDSENASKIMGYILLQGHGDKEMVRLAFGPETLLQNIIFKAKSHLGLSSSSSSSSSTSLSSTPSSTPSTPSSPCPFTTNPIISRPSRHCFDFSNTNQSIGLSSSSTTSHNNTSSCSSNTNNNNLSSLSSPWSNGFSNLRNPSSSSLSYANILNGSCTTTVATAAATTSVISASNANNNNNNNNNMVSDFIDEYQLQDHLSFLNEPKNEELIFDPSNSHVHEGDDDTNNISNFHRRSYSVPGLYLGPEDPSPGLGWRPCLYFARGFCKNGTSCRFIHGDHQVGSGGGDGCGSVGSPSQLSEFETCQEVLRSRFLEQQKRLGGVVSQPQIINGGVSFNYNKCMNLLLQHHNGTHRSNAAAAALMMGEDLHKFSRYRPERMDLSAIGLGMGGLGSPSSRQIYLTFPADSTFREEDVSNYFSIYGPVQDVRIPYQQKRMFGFVTFVHPETVKLILAKGNPHFVCDSRVLVKPYKEKGKIAEKKLQQNLERAEYSACSSPSGTDPREPFEVQLGTRMCYNNAQEILLRKKFEEQADLQQAIEMHGRRLMSLRLLDLTNRNNQHQYRHSLSPYSPIFSPISARTSYEQAVKLPSNGIRPEIQEEDKVNADAIMNFENSSGPDRNKLLENVNGFCSENFDSKEKEEESSKFADSDNNNEGLEHALPENLFASPKKVAGDGITPFATPPMEASDGKTGLAPPPPSSSNPMLSTAATLSMASMKSCFLPVSSFSSGHGTLGL